MIGLGERTYEVLGNELRTAVCKATVLLVLLSLWLLTIQLERWTVWSWKNLSQRAEVLVCVLESGVNPRHYRFLEHCAGNGP